MTEIHQLSLTALKRALDAGELSSREIIEALYARADAVDPAINALVHRFRDTALASADSADEARLRNIDYGPLHGLPITVKESLDTRGTATTLGVRARQRQVAEDDAVVVKVLRQSGAIVIGKTNISQTLLFNESDNPIWGATENPFMKGRVPGGSSGGEAAAVAAGISPLGIGTDIGGSIRVPCAYCGVAGLKPTVDRWSMVGSVGAIGGQESIRSQCGPMARTVEDLALVFRSADGPMHHVLDPMVPPLTTRDPAQVDLRGLRVGYYETDGFLSPSQAVMRGVREAAAALRAQGATVMSFEPPRAVELLYLYFAILSADGGRTLERFLDGDDVVPQMSMLRTVARLPGPVRRVAAAFMATQGEARVERLLSVVHAKPVSDLWSWVKLRAQYRAEVLEAWDHVQLDAVICPPHATVALKHGQSKDFSLGGSYAMRYNTLNFPAGVVPVTRVRPGETTRPHAADRLERTASEVDADSVGLPVGVQVAARPYQEDVCLAVMAAIERGARGQPGYPATPVDPA
ncbi:MAG: amidase [Myxococcales bacterium]|nr:amidase [Myxococcales bacterium]